MAEQPPQQQNQKQQMIGMDATPEQQEKLVHLGQMMGDPRDDFDREVEEHLATLYPHEASAEKMHAAQTGGSSGLGPTEAQANLAKQKAVLQQKAAQQSQVAAQQAQAQQTSPTPPPAPSGPQGVSQPYPAQQDEAEGQ